MFKPEFIETKLIAKNSSEEMSLDIVYDMDNTPECFWFCLSGVYGGNFMQVDFNSMTIDQLEEYVLSIRMIIERSKELKGE